MKDTINSPQVVAALITSIVAIILAVVPTLLNNNNDSAAAPVVLITLTTAPTSEPIATEVVALESTNTDIPPTSEPTDEPPTSTPSEIPPTNIPPSPTPTDVPPTAVPTEIPPSPSPANPPNVILLYDASSFTIYNQSSQTLALDSISFQSPSGRWDATSWGTGLVQRFPADNCLRMRDANSASQQPPAICGTLLGLQLTSGNTLFWLNADEFDVRYAGETIATCQTTTDSCEVYIP